MRGVQAPFTNQRTVNGLLTDKQLNRKWKSSAARLLHCTSVGGPVLTFDWLLKHLACHFPEIKFSCNDSLLLDKVLRLDTKK